MKRGRTKSRGSAAAAELSCEVCGQLPEPHKPRRTLASVAAILPIELLVHALVVDTGLPYLVKVLVLAITATVLVVWVVEPSAMKLLRRWLHAPALQRRRRLDASPALWRVRTTVRDQPGALERLTHGLACLDANILSIHVHPLPGGAMDEFVVETPDSVAEPELLHALESSGGRNSHAWPTTALALADGQTKALTLAVRVAGNPDELPLAVAELLGADMVPGAPGRLEVPHGTILKIPSAWNGPLYFARPEEPFTPAESARAHRLAELAELTELSRSGGRV
jgi:hypothetical protein